MTKIIISQGSQQSFLCRVMYTMKNTWVITKRDLLHWKQNPSTPIMGWLFPTMITLMFGLLFGGAISVPAGSKYIEFLIPGMLTMTMLFGLETTVIAVTMDKSKGITDRFRSMPISSLAVVLGRCFADMLNSIVGLIIMVITGLLLGWDWYGGVSKFLAAIGLLLLLRFALLWIGIFIGLMVNSPESVMGVQIMIWPIGFFSSVFVNPATMPNWIGFIAEWNPISATATAIRVLFANPSWQATTWMTSNIEFLAILWPIILMIVFLPLSVARYRNLVK